MIQGLCESRTFLQVGFKELVCKMLCEESEHKTGALRVRDKLPPEKQLLSQKLYVWQLFLTW